MQPDIDQLFRDNHRKMDEVPPGTSWDKLHMRLDRRKTNNRIKRIQAIAIAAVVFALISFGLVATLYLQDQQDGSIFISAHAYSSHLEQLEITQAPQKGIYSVENVKTMHRLLGQASPAVN